MSETGAGADLRAVHDAVRAALAGCPDAHAVWGPELADDPATAAAALRTAGASWQWVAVGFTGRSFWDLHVGILPIEAGYSVGLHWTPGLDDEVRPWARTAVPDGTLQFAEVAGEYQLLCTDPTGVAVHSTRSVVDTTLAIAARVRVRRNTDNSRTAEVRP
ncbi:hypothetical protein [Micromonospora sp. NBS 11-29]|uniref:hypothetical protein n=1 Tax=Micromonospora sp. NBS 11-29 TaxID=1960879 RepID=UPI000B7833E2|nr:hypothetical protein [Micromonospora sp. NBS 11-29]